MLSFENATSPAAQNTTRPSTMIALRVKPNTRIDLITRPHRKLLEKPVPDGSARRSQQKYVAQENCAVGDDGFTWLQPLQDLIPAILLQAYLDSPLHKMASIARDPHGHGPVAYPDSPVRRHRKRAHRIADTNNKTGKHT